MAKEKFSPDTIFYDKTLAGTVTLQEVAFLWGKTPKQIQWAILRDQVSARRSITGGSWLISYESALSHFGEPVHNIEEWMV